MHSINFEKISLTEYAENSVILTFLKNDRFIYSFHLFPRILFVSEILLISQGSGFNKCFVLLCAFVGDENNAEDRFLIFYRRNQSIPCKVVVNSHKSEIFILAEIGRIKRVEYNIRQVLFVS